MDIETVRSLVGGAFLAGGMAGAYFGWIAGYLMGRPNKAEKSVLREALNHHITTVLGGAEKEITQELIIEYRKK